MKSEVTYKFYGDGREPTTPHLDSPAQREPYIAAPELVHAVNLAMHVGRPLLLEGEAGCGKTRLARAVAYELGLPFYTWSVRSTTKAQDGLYSYDSILRLHDVQIQQMAYRQQNELAEIPGSTLLRNPGNPQDYRSLGPLGRAFALQDCPAVVLIDEIDKADIDFPNDLLAVLDDPWEFEIRETGEKIKAKHRPIIIITSNKEKGNLPHPFLRRCIYYFVEFPDEAVLQRIIEEHYRIREAKPSVELTASAAQRFIMMRNEGNLHKRPSTSEFIDWIEALHSFDLTPYKSEQFNDEPSIPFPSLLLKLRADWQRYHKIQ